MIFYDEIYDSELIALVENYLSDHSDYAVERACILAHVSVKAYKAALKRRRAREEEEEEEEEYYSAFIR